MCDRGAVEGALHWAAVSGNIDIGRLLIVRLTPFLIVRVALVLTAWQGRGCKPSEHDDSGRTPLHRAVGADRWSFGQMLIEYVRLSLPHSLDCGGVS
jgi:ankyrin repeat protein